MKVLFLTCLTNEKEKYDGERIKNTLIFRSLSKIGAVDVVDFTNHKFFNILRTIFLSIFRKRKFDFFIISKDPHGANIIRKVLNFGRVSPSKIIYFEIGPFLYDRVLNGTIKKETFIHDRLIVVETESMKRELESIGFENIGVFPNFKPIYKIEFSEQHYPKNVLNLIYFSRIEEQKGIYDLIDCLNRINDDSVKFKLDIFGRPQSRNDEERIIKICSEHEFLNYKGKLDIKGSNTYAFLSKYDLHVFPTRYSEGFPGTIIDFFIAGVPTLSSNFARAKDIFNQNDSIIFRQGDKNDLISKMLYIYNHQTILNGMRKKSFEKKSKYSVEAFDKFLKDLFINLKGNF